LQLTADAAAQLQVPLLLHLQMLACPLAAIIIVLDEPQACKSQTGTPIRACLIITPACRLGREAKRPLRACYRLQAGGYAGVGPQAQNKAFLSAGGL